MLFGETVFLGKFVHDMIQADKNDERAERISLKAMNQKYEAQKLEKDALQNFVNSRTRLANRKRAVLKSSFPKFLELYSKIMEIKFNDDSRGIKELFAIEKLSEYQTEMRQVYSIDPIKLTDEQLVASFVVPGVIGSTLLNGGLLGVVALGASASIKKDSEINVTVSRVQKREAEAYAEAVMAKKDAIDAVCWHMDETSKILAKLNVLFIKSIRASSNIIESRGYESNAYSSEDLEYIGMCMNLAMVVKVIVDSPILDENNRVIAAAKGVIITGNTCISEFEKYV